MIENFKVGGLKKFGLDAASLRAAFPRLVYCSITGFGQDGPYAERAGYDFIIQGMSGLMDITGEPQREPQKVGVAVVDLFTGVYASTAILAALRQRDRDGVGAHIDMALIDCAVAMLANQAMNYLASGRSPSRLGNAHPNIAPYQVFAVADGHVIVAVGNDRAVPELVRRDRRRGGGRRAGFRHQPAARRQPRPARRGVGAPPCRFQPRRVAGEARGGRRAGRADQPHRRRVRRPAGRSIAA